MSKFEYEYKIDDVLTDATSIVLKDSTESWGIRRSDDGSIIVNDDVSLTRVSVGTYEYEFEDPAYDLEYEYSLYIEYPPDTFNYVTGEFEGLKLVEDYGSTISRPDAEIYFFNRLWSESWENASDRDKEKALLTASKTILNLSLMELETIPQDLKDATCELAFALLDGIDPEREFENLSMVSQGYSNIRSTYDRSIRQEHIESGVVSWKAWQLIKPYLDVSTEIKLSRV